MVKKEQNMENVDDFDFICHIAFNQKPLTRRERAENVKKRDVFGKYGNPARIAKLFGGSENYRAALQEIVAELYKVA